MFTSCAGSRRDVSAPVQVTSPATQGRLTRTVVGRYSYSYSYSYFKNTQQTCMNKMQMTITKENYNIYVKITT